MPTMPKNEQRGSGRTTRQMMDAPQGAVFVWCNARSFYARDLARSLGRGDLVIETPDYFDAWRWQGDRRRVVVDHAFESVTGFVASRGYKGWLAYGKSANEWVADMREANAKAKSERTAR